MSDSSAADVSPWALEGFAGVGLNAILTPPMIGIHISEIRVIVRYYVFICQSGSLFAIRRGSLHRRCKHYGLTHHQIFGLEGGSRAELCTCTLSGSDTTNSVPVTCTGFSLVQDVHIRRYLLDGQIDTVHPEPQLVYAILHRFVGMGYAKEMARASIAEARRHQGFERL